MADVQHAPDYSTGDIAGKLRQTYLQHEEPSPSAAFSSESSAETASAVTETTEAADSARAELEQLQQKYEELHDRYLRLAADFENYRKRMLREREAWAETLTEQLLHHLLPIVDQLQLALETSAASPESLRQGVELIARNLTKLLEQLGVKPIEITPGQAFDVYYHEAMLHVPSEEISAGHIIKELQRGYLFRDRVLRHARVAVSSGPPSDHQDTATESSPEL